MCREGYCFLLAKGVPFPLLCFVYYACTWGFSPLFVLTLNFIPYQKNISKPQGKPIRLKLLEVEYYNFNITPHMWLKAKNMEKKCFE